MLLLQYNTPIGSIANTSFQYWYSIAIFFFGIGIANTYIGYRYC